MLTDLNGEPTKWREIAPFVWREVDGKARLAAEVKDGKVTRFTRRVDLAVHVHGAFLGRERRRLADAGDRREPRRARAHRDLLARRGARAPPLQRAAALRRPRGEGLPLGAHRRARCRSRPIGGWIGTILAMFSELELLSAGLDWLVLVLHVLGTIAVFAGLALAIWHLSSCGRRRSAGSARSGRSCSCSRRRSAPGSRSPTTWSASARTTDAAFGRAGTDPAVRPVHDHGVYVHRHDGRGRAHRASAARPAKARPRASITSATTPTA